VAQTLVSAASRLVAASSRYRRSSLQHSALPPQTRVATLNLMALDGMRVISFESRRATEIAELIRRQGGTPFLAPSMREVPIDENPEALEFAERLFRDEFDMIIFLTGVGTRALNKVLESKYEPGRFAEALRKITTVARGPKPVAALRELNVPVTILVPEPNTWRELLAATAGRSEKRIAVQEYGKSNPELLDGLRARGAEVTAVRVYQWDLPEDTSPLREAARRLASANVDVVMFTTSVQIAHLMRMAAQEGVSDAVRAGFADVVVASIGPTTSEALEEYGVTADIAPTHPKMGYLVKETAEQADTILKRKRGSG
jgi:uroporphyrinogen-III synthase